MQTQYGYREEKKKWWKNFDTISINDTSDSAWNTAYYNNRSKFHQLPVFTC